MSKTKLLKVIMVLGLSELMCDVVYNRGMGLGLRNAIKRHPEDVHYYNELFNDAYEETKNPYKKMKLKITQDSFNQKI